MRDGDEKTYIILVGTSADKRGLRNRHRNFASVT